MSAEESNAKQLQAFVAMCFDTRLDHVYHKVVRPVLEAHCFSCNRADEIAEVGQIVDQIKGKIGESDLVICDLTFENPNVFYEIGIAHTLNKLTIMISQHPANIPFDVRHMRIIPYEDSKIGLLDLRDALAKSVQAFFSLARAASPVPSSATFTVSHDDLAVQRQALFSNSTEARRYAIKFLGDCQDNDSYKTIERLAEVESNCDIVRDAFTALYRIDPTRARSTLLEEGLWRQEEYLVRERVVSLLGNYPPDAELLKQMLSQSSDSSWGVRRNVCMVLGKWARTEAAVELERMLGDAEPQVRLAASEALSRISAIQGSLDRTAQPNEDR